MHVFDAHTHFFSRTFYEYQARKAPSGDVQSLLDKMARAGIDVPGENMEAHRDRIISELDDNGIDRAVSFASVPAMSLSHTPRRRLPRRFGVSTRKTEA